MIGEVSERREVWWCGALSQGAAHLGSGPGHPMKDGPADCRHGPGDPREGAPGRPSCVGASSCSKANAGLDIPPHMAARRLSDRRIERDLQVVQRAARMVIRRHQRKMQRPAHAKRLGTPSAVNGRCFGRVDRVNGRVPVAYPVSRLSQ